MTTANVELCVGTSGLSVWVSSDLGETWDRPYSESGLYLESRCWALASHPERPGVVYAGTDSGVYRSQVRSRNWRHLPSPMDAMEVWALAAAPWDADVLLAGTRPAGLFRSDDGGETWRRLDCAFAESCPFVGTPRVTQVSFDPFDRDGLWAGVEIDGMYRSDDAGETWRRISTGLVSDDVHGFAVMPDGNRRLLFCITNKGLHVSEDDAASWQLRELDSPWQYGRQVVPRADSWDTLFLTNGNGPPGSTGRLLISRDRGANWQEAGLPGTLNSTPWCVATHPADPDLLFCGTNLGQLFRSTDGGANWTKLDREFGELRTVCWLPA